MKRTPLVILIITAAIGIAATTHDFFLLPENFFMHKGDKLDVHLIMGDQLIKQEEIPFQRAKTTRFMLYDGSKKIDLLKLAKDSMQPVISYTLASSGQSLLEMTRGFEYSDASRDNYADFLTAAGYEKLSEAVRNSNQFRIKEKYTRYLKTLVSVDDHDGNAYGKVLNEDYEIILKDNPYKKKYGEDVTAMVRFKMKPVKGASLMVYIRSIGGNVYSQTYPTDAKGEATFTMSREGIFMLRSVHVEATKDKDADYESWWASYTFPFSSSDELPNTYKEFGFGNKH